MDKIKSELTNANETNAKFVLIEFHGDIDGKALMAGAQHVKSENSKTDAREVAVLLIVVDKESNRVAYQSVVPKSIAKNGLKANEWIKTVSDVVGGRGGGKDDQAQGSSADTTRAQEAVKLARQFAQLKLQ